MDEPNSVRCMRHCSTYDNIFFINFPEFCPICRAEIKGSFLVVPPFCVPHPFLSSSQAPFSVVVKPTEGSFLNDYQSGQNLHIGITTSTGLVYNYDENGIHVDKLGWSLCVVVNLSSILGSRIMPLWIVGDNWNDKLDSHSKQPDWAPEKYHPSSHNCYNFVLSFLRTVVPNADHFQDKETFCTNYIVPLTTRAAQYIDLRRNILDKGAYVMKAGIT